MKDLESVIKLTPKAAEMFKEICDEENPPKPYNLLLGLRGGGCAGFQYVLDFAGEKPKEELFYAEQEGIKIYIDQISAMHLEGTVIDYAQGLMGSGFKFINPNAKTCGCGNSFG